ncbi:hypothetical protein AVEN_204685-1, partial [Araneus ventricosus]
WQRTTQINVGSVPVTTRRRSDAHAVTLLDVTEDNMSVRERDRPDLE